MKISETLSFVFERPCSTLESNTQTRLALLLLGFHEVDALPIEIGSRSSKKYVVSSYSCLSKLLETNTKEYSGFLDRSCENVSIELATVSATDRIEALLNTFASTGFGFACVEKESEVRGLVSLRDLLSLYQRSIFTTDLSVKDVASFPIHRLSDKVSMKETLEDMFELKIRRIFVSENDRVISDREIIKYLFSPSRMSEISKDTSALLDARLGLVKSTKPRMVSSSMKLNEAALELYSNPGGCLISEEGVITPWDIIMKPWILGKLVIS